MDHIKLMKEYKRTLQHMIQYFDVFLEEELKNPPMPSSEKDRITELTNLRILAKSDKWPQAVPEDLICGEDEDHKLARAAGIVNEFIRTDLTGKKLLDFGCGEGHVPYVAATLIGVDLAIGYDIENQNWEHFQETPRLRFTNDINVVKNKGPFDVIVLNDVLDHATNPIAVLKSAKDVLTSNGKIYVRCHPWTSRHGTHLYKQLNKAYLHLVFNEDELYGMGLKQTPAKKLLDPINDYRKMINDAGLKTLNEEVMSHPVELFFTHEPQALRRIKEHWKASKDRELATGDAFARDILEIQFVDFILM